MLLKLVITLMAGAGLRLWVFRSSLAEWLSERCELVTPLTSWKRLTEGLALQNAGISPYTGDIYHEPPLSLRFFDYIDKRFGSDNNYVLLFILMDVLIAIVLDAITKALGRYLMLRQSDEMKLYDATADKLMLNNDSLNLNRLYVVGAYMFNPLSIASCVVRSTGVFNNLAIALAILFTLRGSRFGATLFLSLASYQSMYPIMLIVPVAIHLAQVDTKCLDLRSPIAATSIFQTIICTVSALTLLLYSSNSLENSWDFLQSTYGFILSVPDLTPNIGVFWYFFTEMFDHFRVFFLCVFQIHVFIYTVPLTFRLHQFPMFLMYMLLALMSVFKSYPSYSDTALYLALLPQWRHALLYTRNNFVVSVMFVVSVILAPVLWHLWIQTGTANANFYFAITLVLCSAQIFLITDLLYAFLRREYDLRHGTVAPIIDGKPAPVILE